MANLEEQLSVTASIYNPYCFCVMRHIATIALFAMIFRSEIDCLDNFHSFCFNISGFVCQNVLLLFLLIVTFISISICHLLPKEILYNFLMIPPFKQFLYVFHGTPRQTTPWWITLRNIPLRKTPQRKIHLYLLMHFLNIIP